MSSPKRITNWWAVLAMGLFTGMIYILSMPLAGGAGGKLGTISFGVAVSNWAPSLSVSLYRSVPGMP
jgi:hypothetical protein